MDGETNLKQREVAKDSLNDEMCLSRSSLNQLWRLMVQQQRYSGLMVPLFIQLVEESLLVLKICYFGNVLKNMDSVEGIVVYAGRKQNILPA
jgi:hypothetical protein